MTARCASCCYPLTISDSIVCYECSSYFHIDCAQLVGYPSYELSSDPNRNTFLCTTCELLPLPRRQCGSDSDSDSDYGQAMPSRQLDYQLEAHSDYGKDMNEIKGSVQDLSTLCKDMLREINDLKSINLTLRCCVENLRHDNESRDRIITDLTLRLEALELKGISVQSNRPEPIDWDKDGLGVEKEESTERYLTPEPDYTRKYELGVTQPLEMESENPIKETEDFDNIDGLSNCILLHDEESLITETKNKDNKTPSNTDKNDWTTTEYTGYESRPKKEEDKEIEYEEETITSHSSSPIKAGTANKIEEDRRDWSWKGNKAVELENEEDESPDEEEETDETEVDNADEQGWETLEEEIQNATAEQKESGRELTSDDYWSQSKDTEGTSWETEHNEYEDDEKTSFPKLKRPTEEGGWGVQSALRAKRNVEEDDYESSESQESQDVYSKNHISKSEQTSLETEEGEVKIPEEGEGKAEASPEKREGEKLPEGDLLVEAANLAEGELHLEEEPRLEGEPLLEGETSSIKESRLEGEPGDGSLDKDGHLTEQTHPDDLHLEETHQLESEPPVEGQSVEGETTEPPPPPQPQHSEEDLWEYLKDSVTSVHPATVQEFLENLIGTLQHVPEEYLKPVIDANIKRATSPSVTDGEHLAILEGTISPEVGHNEDGEVTLTTDGDPAQLMEGEPPLGAGEPEPSREAGVVPEDSLITEAGSDDAEGLPAVEAAA